MENLILPNERVDDLQFRGLKLIQNPESFCFGTDAVLLADFATVKKNAAVCDLGTGTGILPLLLYGRYGFSHCDAVEIQPDMADMAARSMRLNGLEDLITVHPGDLREIRSLLPGDSYTTVVCNPPYQKAKSGEHNHDEQHRLARHEATCTLEDVCAAAAYLLKYGGRFAMVHHTDRIVDIFETMRAYHLEPKRCRPVQARSNSPAYVVLVEAVKEGKPYMNWESTLCLYDETGQESPELKRIYHREER